MVNACLIVQHPWRFRGKVEKKQKKKKKKREKKEEKKRDSDIVFIYLHKGRDRP